MERVIRFIVQLIIVLIPIGLFIFLFVCDITPSGSRFYRHNVDDSIPFIDRILPDERVLPLQYTAAGDAFTTIIDDPTYFSVHFPNTAFDTIDLEILFKNNGQSIIEVGALVDFFSNAFDLHPLQNVILDQLAWRRLEKDDLVLYQRDPIFDSIDDFFLNIPDRAQIATYHYDLDSTYLLQDYQPLGGEREIVASLRGYHRFVTYVKDENIFVEFSVMDMNRLYGEDDVRVTVRNAMKEVVAEKQLSDDINITENQISSTRSLRVDVADLPEGVYTFELSGTSDVFWRKIRTNLRYVTFINQIYVGDDVGFLAEPNSTTFYTNAKHFLFETLHSDAVQDVQLGQSIARVDQSHEKVRASIDQTGVIEGRTPVGDIKIVGDGKFAFSRDAFFDPDPIRLSGLTDLDSRGIDYVLTTYHPPVQEGDWLKQTVSFDIPAIRNEENDAVFTISAPLIREEQNTVDIHAIHLFFKKDPMTFREVLRAARDLLPFGL